MKNWIPFNLISPISVWLLLVLFVGKEYRDTQWECLIVMFSALALNPLAFRLLRIPFLNTYPLIAALFCAAYLFNPFWYFSIPYLLLAVWFTLREAFQLFVHPKVQLRELVRVFALGYWATGALFAVLYLAGFSPFGFNLVIVSLTAAHFHVAGFVLATLVYCLLQTRPGLTSSALGWAALFGMPLVALGITLTQMGFPSWVEEVSATAFVVFVGVFVSSQLRFAFDQQFPQQARWLLFGGAACLILGGILAALYALRFQWPIQWVSIPNMKIWHGTLNAVGFAWLSLLGFSLSHIDTTRNTSTR